MKKTTNSNTVNISNLTKQKKPKTLPLNSKSYFNFVKPEKNVHTQKIVQEEFLNLYTNLLEYLIEKKKTKTQEII